VAQHAVTPCREQRLWVDEHGSGCQWHGLAGRAST
jgi:hypothetical protein